MIFLAVRFVARKIAKFLPDRRISTLLVKQAGRRLGEGLLRRGEGVILLNMYDKKTTLRNENDKASAAFGC